MLPSARRPPEDVHPYVLLTCAELAPDIARSLRLGNWYVQNLHGLEVPTTLRAHMAVAMLQVAAEHQSSIVSLLNTEWPKAGSALALVRPAVEAVLMGIWVFRAAGEDRLAAIAERRGNPPTLSGLLTSLDEKEFAGVRLSNELKTQLPALNGFTHGGIWHMENRQDGLRIGSSYTPQDLNAALRLADLSAVMAALEMGSLAGDEARAGRMYMEALEMLGLDRAEAPR